LFPEAAVWWVPKGREPNWSVCRSGRECPRLELKSDTWPASAAEQRPKWGPQSVCGGVQIGRSHSISTWRFVCAASAAFCALKAHEKPKEKKRAHKAHQMGHSNGRPETVCGAQSPAHSLCALCLAGQARRALLGPLFPARFGPPFAWQQVIVSISRRASNFCANSGPKSVQLSSLLSKNSPKSQFRASLCDSSWLPARGCKSESSRQFVALPNDNHNNKTMTVLCPGGQTINCAPHAS